MSIRLLDIWNNKVHLLNVCRQNYFKIHFVNTKRQSSASESPEKSDDILISLNKFLEKCVFCLLGSLCCVVPLDFCFRECEQLVMRNDCLNFRTVYLS